MGLQITQGVNSGPRAHAGSLRGWGATRCCVGVQGPCCTHSKCLERVLRELVGADQVLADLDTAYSHSTNSLNTTGQTLSFLGDSE